jgi:hypothetical protein
MKIKHLPFLFCVLLYANHAEAQRSFELGFNSTNVVQNTIGFVGNITAPTEPYTLSFRAANEDNAFRFGLGGGYRTENNQEFGTGILNSHGSHITLSFGYEVRKKIVPKLRYFYGMEASFTNKKDYNNFLFFNPTSSLAIETTDGEKSYTLSPFFGLHYQINKWMGVSTKSRVALTLLETMTETRDPASGIHKGPAYTVDYKLLHILPNSIYLYFNLSEIPTLKN